MGSRMAGSDLFDPILEFLLALGSHDVFRRLLGEQFDHLGADPQQGDLRLLEVLGLGLVACNHQAQANPQEP